MTRTRYRVYIIRQQFDGFLFVSSASLDLPSRLCLFHKLVVELDPQRNLSLTSVNKSSRTRSVTEAGGTGNKAMPCQVVDRVYLSHLVSVS